MPVATGHIPSAIVQPLPDSRVHPATPMMNSARMSRRRRALPLVPYMSRAARRLTFGNMTRRC
jgi:hypothetical protein